MRFVDFKNHGGPEVLFINEEHDPIPKNHEVLIHVKAAGVNRPDISQRSGHYPPPPDASPILGLEVSGVVSKVDADVTRWKVGDKVCALVNGGGYAEYCVAPEGQCLPIPEKLDFVEAASLPEVYFTVWGNLFMRTKLSRGETILIHSGASGIGSCAIQLAKAIGAKVIVTAGSDEKVDFCKSIGADVGINYKVENFAEVIPKDSVDVVLDIIGADYFEKNITLLKVEGRLVQISTLKGSKVEFDLRWLIQKRLTLVGSTLRAQSREAKTRIAEELLKSVWPLFKNRKLKPVVTKVFPFDQVQEAHRWMDTDRHMGKIVLSLGSGQNGQSGQKSSDE